MIPRWCAEEKERKRQKLGQWGRWGTCMLTGAPQKRHLFGVSLEIDVKIGFLAVKPTMPLRKIFRKSIAPWCGRRWLFRNTSPCLWPYYFLPLASLLLRWGCESRYDRCVEYSEPAYFLAPFPWARVSELACQWTTTLPASWGQRRGGLNFELIIWLNQALTHREIWTNCWW